MNKTLESNYINKIESISLSERESLIRSIAGFSELSLADVGALVGLMEEVVIRKGEKIVTEGDVVDSIYIIARGSAEVTKKIDEVGKMGETLLALLNQGECIGLKEAKLFSETGTRTATVTANTPSTLLRLELKDFHKFLEKNKHILTSLNESVDLALRMQFIKSAAPFSKLPSQRILWLANLVKDFNVNADEEIFGQGDKPENCYMIAEGTVEISTLEESGLKNTIAILQSGQLFGVAALLSNARHNASARALLPCKLLVMEREIMLELIEKEAKMPASFLSFVADRSKPVRREDIMYQHRTTADGEHLTTLKDGTRNKYLQLTEEGWFVWQQLNGQLTLQEISQLFYTQFERTHADKFLTLFSELVDEGFAYIDLKKSNEDNEDDPSKQGKKGKIHILNFKYLLKGADKNIGHLYGNGARFIFSTPAILISLLVLISGFVFFRMTVSVAIISLPKVDHIYLFILATIFMGMTLHLFNSLLKALTMKHFNYEVTHLGFSWRIIGPWGFIDTSPLLLGSNWSRVAVIISGIMADLIIAALVSCFAYYNNESVYFLFAWTSALSLYLIVLRSLDPLLDSDGYQLLTNMLDTPKLRELAINWLLQAPAALLKQSQVLKHTKLALVYWVYSFLYLITVLILVTWMLKQFMPYLPQVIYIKQLIPGIIVTGYLLAIGGEARSWRSKALLKEMM